MMGIILCSSGMALMLARPVAIVIGRRRYDQDVAAGTAAALQQSYAPPATDRELLDLLKEVQ